VPSEAEENKVIVRCFLEATARGALDAMDEMIAPDFVDRSLMTGQEPDREGFKRSVAEMDAPFTNPQGKMFGTPRLRNLLSQHSMGGADLSAKLMEELRRFTREGWEQEDDITLK
jgi:hypothetical protein